MPLLFHQTSIINLDPFIHWISQCRLGSTAHSTLAGWWVCVCCQCWALVSKAAVNIHVDASCECKFSFLWDKSQVLQLPGYVEAEHLRFYKIVRLLQTGSHTLHLSSNILIFFVTKLPWLSTVADDSFSRSHTWTSRSLYAVLSHPGWSVDFWIAFLSPRLNAGIKQLKEKRFTRNHTDGGFCPWPPGSCCLCAWHAHQSRQKQMTEKYSHLERLRNKESSWASVPLPSQTCLRWPKLCQRILR